MEVLAPASWGVQASLGLATVSTQTPTEVQNTNAFVAVFSVSSAKVPEQK